VEEDQPMLKRMSLYFLGGDIEIVTVAIFENELNFL